MPCAAPPQTPPPTPPPPRLNVQTNDREAQIISLALDKTMRVWDIRSHRCMQVISDSTDYRPENIISCMMWDGARRALITTNTRLRQWPIRFSISEGTSAHEKPVSSCLFNRKFEEALSGDHAGMICVWDPRTGNMRSRFNRAHGDDKITAMAFDGFERRLITGSDTGDIRVWNYSRLDVLKENENPYSLIPGHPFTL